MVRLALYAAVFTALIGLVVAFTLNKPTPSDVLETSIATSFIECAAYYQVTAEALQRDGDDEFSGQYRERASLAWEAGTVLTDLQSLEHRQRKNHLVEAFTAQLSQRDFDLGDLASQYDDRCMALIQNE